MSLSNPVTRTMRGIAENAWKKAYARERLAYHWEQIGNHPVKQNAFVVGRYRNVITLLKDALAGLAGKMILDVGCGDGVLSYLLAKEKAIVSGIDNQEIAIRFAKKKTSGTNIDFRVGSAYELPWDENSFDAVVSSDVIEHLQDTKRYLEEIKRVSKVDAVVVISTPIRFTEKPLDKMHVVEWFPNEFKKVIESVFPNSRYFKSHPVFWFELINRNRYCRVMVNLLSIIRNPFEGFDAKFHYDALQYSVSTKYE